MAKPSKITIYSIVGVIALLLLFGIYFLLRANSGSSIENHSDVASDASAGAKSDKHSGGTDKTSGEWRIGALYWSMNIEGQVAMRKGLEAEVQRINKAAEKGLGKRIKLFPKVAGDGEKGIETQIGQMRELIGMKVDLIVVQPTDNAALAEPLKEANDAGIPVVAYDQYINGGKLDAYVTSDNYQAGWLDGEYIAARFAKDDEIQLILVEYPHVSSTVERVNGFIDALDAAKSRYKVLKSYTAVEPVSGKKAGNDILRDFPAKNSVDVVFTVNDGGGLSVVDALAKAGRSEIMVATIDGDPRSVKNIRSNRLTVIDSAQFCGPLGAEAIRAGYSLLSGTPPSHHILVPVFPIAAETLNLYPGWMGPIPKEFRKPWRSTKPVWSGAMRVEAPKE